MHFIKYCQKVIAILLAVMTGIGFMPASALANNSGDIAPLGEVSLLSGELADYAWYDLNKAALQFSISSASQLQGLADIVNGNHGAAFDFSGRTIKLMADIDLSGYESFIPIGTSSTAFSGTFNGNGHTISNLTINAPTQEYVGLFGMLYGTVSNLHISSVNITGYQYVGGIAGQAFGNITHCAVTNGTVSGYGCTGGIVGIMNGSLTASFATCNVFGRDFSPYGAGGVAGKVDGGSVINCYSTGSVKPAPGVSGYFTGAGGIAGSVSSGSVQNCFATGEVSATMNVGGIAGSVYGGYIAATLTNCAALNIRITGDPGTSSIGGPNVGRVAGRATGSFNATNMIAFSGMIVTGSGSSNITGTDKSSADIKATDFFISNGFISPAWSSQTEMLPILTGYQDGLQSGELPAHIGSPTPTEPLSFTGAPDSGQVKLSWSAPGSPGASSITRYEVQKDGGSWISVNMATTYTYTGLTNGTAYTFRVRAVNSYGNGAVASTQRVPVSSGDMAAIAGDQTVLLNWATPAALISKISFYQVRCDGSAWILADESFAHTYYNLANGVTYTFDMQAVGQDGTFVGVLFSDSVEATPVGKPLQPLNLAAAPGNGQIALSWDPPYSDGGSAITGYEVSKDNGQSWVLVPIGTAHTFTGLINASTYTLMVRAVNAMGTGNAASITATPRQPPGITSSSSYSMTYGSGGSFSVTASGTAPLTYSLFGQPGGVSIDASTGAITVEKTVPANVYSFTVTVANGSLPNAQQGFTLTINRRTPQLSDFLYTAPSNRTYDGSNPGIGSVTDKNGIGLSCTVYYQGTTGTVYSKSETPPKNAGEYAVTAGITGSTNFNAAELTLGSFRILPKSISVTPAAGQNKVFGQPDPLLQYTLSAALAAGDVISGGLSRAAGENVGNYGITMGSLSAGNNYTLSLSGTVSFTINPKADAVFTIADIPPRTYTGSVITPEPQVKVAETVLVKSVDFTYGYSSNTYAGTAASVSITGKGNYAGSTGSKTFTIEKAVPSLLLTANPASTQTRPGSIELSAALPVDATGTLTFRSNSTVIGEVITLPANSTTFTPTGASNTYSFTVEYSGDSNYESTTSAALGYSFTKSEQADLVVSNGTVDFGSTLDLAALVSGGSGTGGYSFTVISGPATLDGTVLNPTGVGDVSVLVTKAADNDYHPRYASFTVTVNPRVITFTVTPVEMQIYTGSAIVPEPQVKDAEKILTKNVDFTYGYSNNIYVGTDAKVSITGIGNYAGSTGSAAFTIEKAVPSLLLTANPASTQTRPGSIELCAALPADATGTLTFRSDSTVIGEVITLPAKTTTFTPTGASNTYSFTVEYSGDSNYESTTSEALGYSFTKSEQADLVVSNGTVDFGSTLDLAALVSGGSGTGVFQFTVSGGGATLDGSTLSPTGADEITISVTKAADHDYHAKSSSFTVTVNPRVIAFNVAPVAAQIHTGSAITPEPEVKDAEKILTKNEHFIYDYSNNTDPSVSAVVDVIGIGGYAGSAGSATFTIGGAMPEILTLPSVNDKVYAGTTFSKIVLTGGGANTGGHFEWMNPAAKAVKGPNTAAVRFIPDDTVLYAQVDNIPFTFTAVQRPDDERLPTERLNQPSSGTMAVPAAVVNGQATLAITESMVRESIQKAIADARSNINAQTGVNVAISVTAEDATSFAISIEQNALTSLIDSGVRSFGIDSLPVNLRFDLEALRQIKEQSGGDISVTVRPVQMSGLINAYDISISTVKGGRIVNISSLGTGFTTLGISAAPGPNESGGNLYGVYVDANKKRNRIAHSVYDANSGRVIFSASHLSVYGVAYQAPDTVFTDTTTHWAKEAIDFAAARGLMTGSSNTLFSPDTAITRGEFIMALGKLASTDVSGYKPGSFTDVSPESAYSRYIEWAYSYGIQKGIGSGLYGPDRAVTREEISLIFLNYAKATGFALPVARKTLAFTDNTRIGNANKAAVAATLQAGIMAGQDNRFNPKAAVTRAQACVMLHRYMKLTIDAATAQGWAQNDDGEYLFYRNGVALKGRQSINGIPYFFTTSGILRTGWVRHGNNWYYYTGNRLITGWWDIPANDGTKRYYFTDDGIRAAKKWLQIDGKWYYFYSDGSLARSAMIGGYVVGADGVRKTK